MGRGGVGLAKDLPERGIDGGPCGAWDGTAVVACTFHRTYLVRGEASAWGAIRMIAGRRTLGREEICRRRMRMPLGRLASAKGGRDRMILEGCGLFGGLFWVCMCYR